MEVSCTKPKKKPSKIEEMTKEQIREAILKKRECNAKAQTIVENLLEKGITECYFLQCLPDINQSHFEDIIEERAIIHICGYPVCKNPLFEKDIPKQKYRISMKTNKVYDITARKSFCSNSCYKAAMHVKKQMLTSPLWFREYEEIPKFHLLPLDTVGSLGQEVDVSIVEKIKIKSEQPQFSSINDFAQASLNEIHDLNMQQNCNDPAKSPENEPNISNNVTNNNTDENKQNKHVRHIITKESHSIEKADISKETNKNVETPNGPIEIKKPSAKSNPLNIVGEIVEKPEKKIDPILTNAPENIAHAKQTKPPKSVPQKKPPAVTALTIEVEKCLAEWFTLDTMLMLFGEERVKEMVTDKGECIKEYLNNYANSIAYNSHTYDQYQALCRKLNMLELEDRKYDTQTLQRESKPLPDYSILQEESKKIQLKVKAFYAGEMEIPELNITQQDKRLPEEVDRLTQLPLVDKNAQNALRRRIVCEHLDKVLPDLLRSLGLLTLTFSSDVRHLVSTFKLKANNIMFKPIQWTLIAIIVIKLLSLRDKRLAFFLEQPIAFRHLQLLLLSFQQDGGYLDRLISWLTDIDRLIDTNDTQLTIE